MEDDDGDYRATMGMTLTLMYGQRMQELVPAFDQMINLFEKYISPRVLNSMKPDETWRDYTVRSRARLLNRFRSESKYGEDLVLALLEEDSPFQYFGEFGIRLSGRSDDRDSPFRQTDACAAYFELPIGEVERVGRGRLIAFVKEIADLVPFNHGMCGYTFKYFHRAGSQYIDAWVGDKASRYLAIHPFRNHFEYYCRDHIANVNWITLLGEPMVQKLGGTSAMREALSADVVVTAIKHGTVLIAGEKPPLGDVNHGAKDLGPLREVHRLTEPLMLDRTRQLNRILNYLFEEERALRWLDRFDWSKDL